MIQITIPVFCVLLIVLLSVAGCSAARKAVTGGSAAAPAAAALQPSAAATTTPDPNLTVGIIGDSFYDEYRGTDNRGGQYAPVTFNLVELLARRRGFNFGPWGEWGEPRREGYEYNWARSGANTGSMLAGGQHTGLAEQIAAGKVNYVFIGIGANDFSPNYGPYKSIYDGEMSDEELAAKIKGAVNAVTTVVDTVQQAGAKGVAVALFMQWELDPTLPSSYPDAQRRQRVADAIDAVNDGIKAMAAERGVAVVDQTEVGRRMLESFDSQGNYVIDGEKIDFMNKGDEPHHSRLADGSHVGTVMSGITANYYFIDTFNRAFGFNIPPLTDEEILQEAGLRP